MGPGCFHPRNERPARGSVRHLGASMGPGCFHPKNSHSSIYSIFKDLGASSRAPLHLKPISNSSTILRAANPRPLVTLSARERPPLDRKSTRLNSSHLG